MTSIQVWLPVVAVRSIQGFSPATHVADPNPSLPPSAPVGGWKPSTVNL
jgi:hypothetical protein